MAANPPTSSSDRLHYCDICARQFPCYVVDGNCACAVTFVPSTDNDPADYIYICFTCFMRDRNHMIDVNIDLDLNF